MKKSKASARQNIMDTNLRARKITVDYLRKKYPQKYACMSDEAIQMRLDFYYELASIGLEHMDWARIKNLR